MISVNGNFYVTQALFKGAEQESIENDIVEPKLFDITSDQMMLPVSVKLGKTVTLPKNESARINVGITAYVEADRHDECYQAILDQVRAWLNYESAAFKGDAVRPDFNMSFNTPLLLIWLDYGITINVGDYRFAKADVGRTIPCSSTNLAQSIAELDAWMEAKIGERVDAIHAAYRR